MGKDKYRSARRGMARTFGKKATQIGGQFTPRLIEMLESAPYRVLSLSAHRVLSRLEIELGNHGGKENGRLPCTYEHFQEYGIDRDSIAPAIRELVALGFVEITEHGTAGNREFRRPNRFRLTFRHTERAGPTEDWRAIKTNEEALAIAREARSSKTKTSRGFPRVSVGETPSETASVPLGETPTTGPVGKTPTTSISPPTYISPGGASVSGEGTAREVADRVCIVVTGQGATVH